MLCCLQLHCLVTPFHTQEEEAITASGITMGGDSVVSHDQDSSLDEDFPLLSRHSPSVIRNNLGLQDEDNVANENGFAVGEFGEGSIQPSSTFDFEVNVRKKLSPYQEILQSYDESNIDSKCLKEAKEKILSYSPGTWIEKVGGLKFCDYDVPKTTCLILVGPKGSGKSSLINRISKVLEDDIFAPARAQISYNSLVGDGTYFLQEYMIPRHLTSICLYDTRSLSCNSNENDNNRMLESWMTEGVRHGELVIRNTDARMLKKSLECKRPKKSFISSTTREVNYVIYVVNGLSVLKAMENASDSETQYIETIISTFNCPFLSFKDDKPVLVFTHGDLLSLSDRVRIRVHLGELLGIPPTKQIFDIPECEDLVTESNKIAMLRYSLEHAERNFSQNRKVLNKVRKTSLLFCMILLILVIGVAIAFEYHKSAHHCHAPLRQACCKKDYCRLPKLKVPEMELKVDWHKIRHIW